MIEAFVHGAPLRMTIIDNVVYGVTSCRQLLLGLAWYEPAGNEVVEMRLMIETIAGREMENVRR